MLLQSDIQLNRHSYYEASVQRPPALPALQGDIEVDVLVVGGGFAGLSAAIALAKRGYRVALLEADRVCSGASGRNGGQFIVGVASGQGPFEEQLGLDAARQVWDMSLDAVALLEQRVRTFSIDCDLRKGYMTVADSARKARALEVETASLRTRYGFESAFYTGAEVGQHIGSTRYCAAAVENTSGHLHPLKYGLGLLRAAQSLGVQVFEHSAVTTLERGEPLWARTAQGSVRARFGVLAGNCMLPEYGPRVAPELAPRTMPVGTYIIGTEPLSEALCQSLIPSGAAVCDNNFVLDYFRCSADQHLLFGGRVSYSTRTPSGLQARMARRMASIFPALERTRVDYVWGGFVDISMNRAPDFGRLGSNLYYLQGFSGHGVALTGLAGELAAQAIAGQAERFDLFARLQHRPFPGGPKLRTPSLVLGMLYHRLRDML
jgi:gamma-glutamylputrescine oxidase